MALTQTDLDEIEKLLDGKLDEKLNLLPTKDEFFSQMSRVMGELKGIREDQAVISGKQSEYGDRLTKLESTQTTS